MPQAFAAALAANLAGADVEAICRRAALLALREWIAPKLSMARVQVTETTGDAINRVEEGSVCRAERSGADGASGVGPTPSPQGEQETTGTETGQSPLPTTRFLIRPEHFAHAIDEQRERYAIQEEAEEVIARKEAGRQRLLEAAANMPSAGQRPRRGFRYWLARLLGLAS